jgi:hypothetical protein
MSRTPSDRSFTNDDIGGYPFASSFVFNLYHVDLTEFLVLINSKWLTIYKMSVLEYLSSEFLGYPYYPRMRGSELDKGRLILNASVAVL